MYSILCTHFNYLILRVRIIDDTTIPILEFYLLNLLYKMVYQCSTCSGVILEEVLISSCKLSQHLLGKNLRLRLTYGEPQDLAQ